MKKNPPTLGLFIKPAYICDVKENNYETQAQYKTGFGKGITLFHA